MLRQYIILQAFLRDRRDTEHGATAVEYALMVALIAVAIIAAVTALGGGLKGTFNAITTALGGTASTG